MRKRFQKLEVAQYIIATVLVLVLIIGWMTLLRNDGRKANSLQEVQLRTEKLSILTNSGQSHEFEVELALTEEQMEQGLMFRQSLADNSGMLFLFEPIREVNMWMKNTFISLDMIFADRDGRIVAYAEKTRPHSTRLIPSGVPVYAVLEVNGGTVERLGVEKGDWLVSPSFLRQPE